MPQPIEYLPRRSCLYMPGANQRALEKAKTLASDMLILDLEDAVAPDAKQEARNTVSTMVQERAYGFREVLIRCNGLETQWGQADLAMSVQAAPDGIVLPKICCAQDVDDADAALTLLGAPADLGLWIMIEMPMAILNIQEIAATKARTRLRGFIMGTNDLAKELNAQATADRAAYQTSLSMALLAARAFGLIAIDGVYNDIKNDKGLEQECVQGRVLGFDGKTLIHPAQLDQCNAVFSPDAEAVSQARDVIAAFNEPENESKGVITVNGKMTERLHLEQAQHLVAIHEAIESRA